MIRRLREPFVMPRWGWIVLAVLTALMLLPVALRLYGLWWTFASGDARGVLIEFLMPRVAGAG